MAKKISSLKGKFITAVTRDGGYYTLQLQTESGRKAGAVTIHVDSLFDGDGNRLEDDTK